MQRTFLLFLFTLLFAPLAQAEDYTIYDLVPGQEYYILNTYYNRPLGNHTDGGSPRLVNYDASRESSYLWQVESSGTAGYVLLRQKSSGRYMVASTTNNYSVLLTATPGTATNYQWRVRPGLYGSLVNRRSTGNALGVDKNETTDQIGVWYDKSFGTETSTFAVFPSNGQGLEASHRAWLAQDILNIIDLAQDEILNTRNPQTYRSRLKTSIETAKGMIADKTVTPGQLQTKAANMRDSLVTMMNQNETRVLLTQQDMSSFGSTFSLALTGLTLNTQTYPADSIYYIIRGRDGRGAKVTIRQDGDYVFVKQEDKMHVYLNDALLETLPAVYLPKLTAQDTEAEWTLLRKSRLTGSQPEILSETKVLTQGGGEDTDKYGNKTRTVISLTNSKLTLDHPVDFHIMSESSPLDNCTINLAHEKAWLIFDNALPSSVRDNYLKYIQINGKKAVLDENCRIVIYLNGALVMPFVEKGIFQGFDGEQYTGNALSYGLGSITDLRKNSNRIRSFHLKRGYMVTLASDKDGKGYSRVYVADHHDLEVPVLPNALYGRISSINVRKWQYVSKKGWCSTTGSSAIAAETKKVRATWFYTWSADRSSTIDNEYIPIKQHIYWPGFNDINSRTECTAVLGYNEPDHGEQHDNCDCKGTIDPWKAYTHASEFLSSGLRIGSAAPTDASWLTDYIGHCNDMQTRCDFVAIHCYWGPNEAANADAWKSRLQDIYNKTKRPIWITEWNYGASWTTEGWPSDYGDKLEKERAAIKSIQSMLESLPFVERYAVYNWDTYYRAMINWDDGSVLPAGKVYRDMKSDFAYNADVQFTPVWWSPSLKTPQVKVQINEADEQLLLQVTNDNRDVTDRLVIQLRHAGGEWQDYYTEQDRYLFDENLLSYTFPLSDFNPETDQLRVYVKRTLGDETYSAPASFGYIQNPDIVTATQTAVDGWECTRSAANGYTKAASGDTYLEVWDATSAGMQFDYHQDITDLPSGIYELSAAVFNSTNGIDGATVNGSVVLYAQADSVMYAAQVTRDSEIDYDQRLTIPGIVVRGGQVRIGIRNIGDMKARWAGGDSFRLIRTAPLPGNGNLAYVEALHQQNQALCDAFMTYTDETHAEADASSFIVNRRHERKDNYGWTVTNGGTASDKPADGQSGNAYWNLWKSTPFTATMTQDIPYLPEGEYSLNAIVRGSANESLTLKATVIRNGEEKSSDEPTTASLQISGQGEGEVAGSGLPSGWMKMQTPFVVIRPGDTLRLSLTAQATSGSCWWSADDFGLTWRYTDTRTTGLQEVPVDRPTTPSVLYDLTGRKLQTPVQRGIYIQGGKKLRR